MANDDTEADLEVEIETFDDLASPTDVASPTDIADAPTPEDSTTTSSSSTLPAVNILDRPERPSCHLIAFAAGRGGTGRSLIAANVAIYLAQAGKKVVAIDADPAGGPLHQLLGASRPPRGYGEMLRARVQDFGELITDTPIAGVRLVGGESSIFGSLKTKQGAKTVLAAIRSLEADYVVVDLGSPESTLTIDLWLAADLPVVVTLPDPASIEASYRFIKSSFVRKLRTTRGLDRVVSNPIGGGPPSAVDIYRTARDNGGPAERIKDEIRVYRPRFIVNQTRALSDLKLGLWMQAAAQRRLGHTFEYLGHVESDETVWLAARRRRPLLAEYPEAKVAKNIERITRRLLSSESERERGYVAPMLRLEEEQTHYEVLETEPGVSDEEVRRAYRSLKEIYSSSSPVVAGLYDERSWRRCTRAPTPRTTRCSRPSGGASTTWRCPRRTWRAPCGRRRSRAGAGPSPTAPRARMAAAIGASCATSRPSRSSRSATRSPARCCARSASRAGWIWRRSRSARRSASATCDRSRRRRFGDCRPRSTCAGS